MDTFSPLLAGAEPPFDAPYFVALVSRVLHTTCGATLLGGLIYLRFVLAPAVENQDEAVEKLYAGRRQAWGKCVAVCSSLLLLSGVYNLILFTRAYENLPSLYHPLFGAKFLLAFAVMLISAFISGKTALADRMRAKLSFWLNVALLCALAVFVLSATLRSFRDLPDAREAPPASYDEAPPAFGADIEEIEIDSTGGIEIELGE